MTSDNSLQKVPALRMDLDFIPVEDDGQRLVVVRDPLGLVPQGVAIPEPVFALMALMNGQRTVRDIMDEIGRIRGDEAGDLGIDETAIASMVQELDRVGLLASDYFRESYQAIRQEYASLAERPMTLDGKSYPAQAGAFSTWVEDCLDKGSESGVEGRIKAVVAPHLEPSVSSGAYGSAYGLLKGEAPERVLILGIGHAMHDALFSVSAKGYATPLGTLAVDGAWAERLRTALPGLVSADDFDHRNEHSIEFQAVFLKQLFPDTDVMAIPMLCGSTAMFREKGRDAYLKAVAPLLDPLRQLVSEEGTLVVAGVDLSHIGPKFGHDKSGRDLEAPAREHEERLLECVLQQDAPGLWQEMQRVEDRFNVCGFPALACLLEILPPGRGNLLEHAIWHEQATGSAVSYASLAITA